LILRTGNLLVVDAHHWIGTRRAGALHSLQKPRDFLPLTQDATNTGLTLQQFLFVLDTGTDAARFRAAEMLRGVDADCALP